MFVVIPTSLSRLKCFHKEKWLFLIGNEWLSSIILTINNNRQETVAKLIVQHLNSKTSKEKQIILSLKFIQHY